eukprot:c15302_g1_i4.p1 GENE.c15302_g1_i4~~c15302_g1_i4.p1  ORF type:complete len:176 (+),score=25.46 c15302_g1_i4:60-530(+)
MTPEEVAGLLSRLNKKDTFVEAVTELQQAISEYPRCAADTQAALFKAVKRTHVLLTTRYSSTIAWIAGRALFVQAASSFDDEPTKALIADMILSADLHCVEPTPSVAPPVEPTPDRLVQELMAMASIVQDTMNLDSGPPPASRDALCVANPNMFHA